MDKPTDTPETIYLIPDTEHGHVWCDDPAPGLGMDPEDAIEYRRADVADTALAAAEARIAELESDSAKLKEFAIEAFQTAFNGHDWCGDDIQDAGVRTGLLEQTAFDPDEHTTDCEFLEPGDTFYVFAALLKEKE